MTKPSPDPYTIGTSLRWSLWLTRLGMAAERLLRAFWPLWTLVMASLALVFLGFHDQLPVELVWITGVAVLAGAGAAAWFGVRRFRLPSAQDARDRLDATLPGRPIAALSDTQAIGAGDAASEAVWFAHKRRMETRLAEARAVDPDLRLSRFDRYGLRYIALTLFLMALMFGSVWRVDSLSGMAPAGGGAVAAGPSWEGWVEPPAHTGRPSLYLNDIAEGPLRVPVGSRIELRLYGQIGDLTVSETVSGRTGDVPGASEPRQGFEVARNGVITVDGAGGRSWSVSVLPDAVPEVSFEGAVSREANGELSQMFRAVDDYGVVAGTARITLDLSQIDRRYGLTPEPDPVPVLELDLPMAISRDRSDFTETLLENLSEHPWAELPVEIVLTVEDAIGQQGMSETRKIVLPGRRFFDPLAKAIIEQRRDLLWSFQNAERVSQLLRAVSHRPEGFVRSETNYLRLRVTIRRLETATRFGLTDETRAEIAKALWDLAIQIEEGDLSDALERLRRAQDRLSEAIENGADENEIARLMQELREAMQDYMRQLAEQMDPNQDPGDMENAEAMTGDQLEEMLNRLQELMEQGRMAEAQQLLDQLRRMMENMQMAQGQQQGQQGAGQQAMNGLQETLRDQQDLSDESFQDLQEQFNGEQQGQQPGQQQGQEQGQQPGQQGQGQQPGQQQGQGQQPGQQGQGQQPGQQQGQRQQPGQPGQGQPGGPGQSLADRQQALRDTLRQQEQNLPGSGPGSDAARDALDRAGRAMQDAENALREDDLAGALDNQADAMDAIREGMQQLGEELAQQQQQQGGQPGENMGQANPNGQRDPLGRSAGADGQLGSDDNMLQDEDVYRRAQDLLDEIRRRSGEQARPDAELDYLRRLLDRF